MLLVSLSAQSHKRRRGGETTRKLLGRYRCKKTGDVATYLHVLMCREREQNKKRAREIDWVLSSRSKSAAYASNYGGDLPLHYAVGFHQHPDVIMRLINLYPEAAGAKSKRSGFFGAKVTPLHVAIGNGSDLSVIQMLIKACPRVVKVKDEQGNTPAMVAAHEIVDPTRRKEVLSMLRDSEINRKGHGVRDMIRKRFERS